MMKVKELMEILENLNPEANVIILSAKNYPFENAVVGVKQREGEGEDFDPVNQNASSEFLEAGQEESFHKEPSFDGRSMSAADDAIICVGNQLRYGSPHHWDELDRDCF